MHQPVSPAGVALMVVLYAAFVCLGTASLVLTFTGRTSSWLPTVLGGVASAFVFVHWPLMGAPDSARRGPATVLAGRILIALLWVLRIGIVGLFGYVLAGLPADQTFDLRLAAGALIGWLMLPVNQLGRWMTGFPARPDIRPAGILRSLGGMAVVVVAAGFGHQLKKAASVLLFWVPSHTYTLLHGWWSTNWFAVTASIPVWAVWLVVCVVILGFIPWLLSPFFGEGSVLPTWAQQPEPHETTEAMWMWMTGAPASPGTMRRLRRKQLQLSGSEQKALINRAGDALRAVAPPGWHSIHAEYRAVLGHDELDCTVTTADGDVQPLDVPVEAVRPSLERLRASLYEPAQGTWFTATINLPADDWPTLYYERMPEPPWDRPPTRRQLSDDLRRFPILPALRPPWLTAALRG